MVEIYLKRKIDDYLKLWKADPDRKPLLVKGPRQVGKTESIRKFADENYSNIIYINFVEEPKYKLITEDGFETDYDMNSMDFEEFLWAKGCNGSFIDDMLAHMIDQKPFTNIVGEALVKSGYELYYYKREDSTLEEDFFVRSQKSLFPVEVKPKTGNSKSLRSLINGSKYSDISSGIKLSANNIGYSNGIYTFPYFCTFLLRKFIRDLDR